MNDKKKETSDMIRTLGLFSVILTDLVGYTLAGMGLGYLAWKKLGWPSWVLVITTTIGMVLAFYKLFLLWKKEWKN